MARLPEMTVLTYETTLRDQFAMAALSEGRAWAGSNEGGYTIQDIVRTAYEIADAMLDERDKETQKP